MTDVHSQEISVEEMMTNIQQEVVESRSLDFGKRQMFSGIERSRKSSFDWQQINANLDVAENHADIGTKMLPLLRFGRGVRWVARQVGRIVLYVSKIVTIPQMHFNRSLLQTVRSLRNGLQHLDNHLNERDRWVGEKFNEIEVRHNWVGEKFEELENFQAKNKSNNEKILAELDKRLTGLINSVNDHKKTISYLRRDTVIQERRLGVLLEEAKKRLPEPFDPSQLETFTREDSRFLDPLYISFEDEFRGTRSEIKNKLKEYLPLLINAKAGSVDRPILDVGCGRGEWLELLKEENLIAKGLDLNRTLVEQNMERGFEVFEGDVIEYLTSLPNESLGAVTGFHLIEHLPFNILLSLFDETIRVLQSGGIVIFETPNPENILVGACHFYADPTHKNPLPSYVLQFIAEYRGLSNVKIMKLHPFPENLKITGSEEIVDRFNEYFYGPRDYALIGYNI